MSSRRLEQQTTFALRDGDTMKTEWEPFTGEGREVPDTHGWKTADFTAFCREWNRAAKARGDMTRVRSVESEDAFS